MEHFFSLTPERILGAVETALGSAKTGIRATGRTLALNSMENRVYEIELDNETSVVTKFYRPGRWTREAILDEHAFIHDLGEAEVPAIAPLLLDTGSTLGQSDDGILFAVFPKVRGRITQELDDSQLEQIGRLLARLHNVGSKTKAQHRLHLTVETYAERSLEFLEKSRHIDPQLESRYRHAVSEIVRRTKPMLEGVETFRIHGDCHLGNVLWQSDGPFFLDFDDMVTGPATQDIWMIVRGRDEEADRQRDVLIRGYEQMRSFDRKTLALVEPLRSLRLIHYAAWIGRRWEDPTFKNAFPEFGSYKYWQEQVADLEEQLRFIPA